MVTMTYCGITIAVPPSDVAFYKSVGYVIVVPEKPAPVEPAENADEKPVIKSGKK